MRLLAVATILFASSQSAWPDPLPVLRSTAYPGDVITAPMLSSVDGRTFHVGPSFATQREQLIGKMAKRTILSGQPIPTAAIREPYTVRQGKPVPVIGTVGSLIITSTAVAIESGSVGEIITARNPESGAILRGVIQPDGSLSVDVR